MIFNKRLTAAIVTILTLFIAYQYIPELMHYAITYLWLPIVNDSGYNIYSSIFYSIVVLLFLYLIPKFSKHFQLKIDPKFIYCLIPFIFVGSIWRVIEDSGSFDNSIVQYVFISPLIYILLTITVLFAHYLGQISKRIFKENIRLNFIYSIITAMLIPLLIFSFEYHINIPVQIPVKHHFILLLLLTLSIYILKKYTRISFSHIIISFSGIHLILVGVLLIFLLNKNSLIELNANYLDIIFQTIGYSILFLFPFIMLIWFLRKVINRIYSLIFQPIIILIIFGILLDGLTSVYAISIHHKPKHILTSYIIDNFRVEYILLIKVIMISFIILFIKRLHSVYPKINLNSNTFYILFLFTILTINLSPALRVILRMCLST